MKYVLCVVFRTGEILRIECDNWAQLSWTIRTLAPQEKDILSFFATPVRKE